MWNTCPFLDLGTRVFDFVGFLNFGFLVDSLIVDVFGLMRIFGFGACRTLRLRF